MNPHFLESSGLESFTRALLQSLWLGLIPAALLLVALWCLPVRRGNLRYAVSLAALGLVVVLTGMSWSLSQSAPRVPSVLVLPPGSTRTGLGAVNTTESVSSASSSSKVITLMQATAAATASGDSIRWLPWITGVWLFGASLMLFRLLLQLLDLRHIRRHSSEVRADEVHQTFRKVAFGFGLEGRVRLASSSQTSVPGVFGIFLPTVLLPAHLLTGVPIAQLTAILAHEMAHIRRYDFLVNLLQSMLEVIYFFNPSVWWINSQIRQEREACCDQMAVRYLGDDGVYVEAITQFVSARRVLAPELATAVTGGDLLDRVRRLLSPRYRPVFQLPWYSLLGSLLLAAVVLAGLWKGTDLAVTYAAEVLNADQRAERLAEIGKSYSGPAEPAIRGPATNRVTGRFRLEDGAALPKGLSFLVNTPGFGNHRSLNEDGSFTEPTSEGPVSFAIHVPNFAPLYFGPIHSSQAMNLDLVIRKGYSASLLVTNSRGGAITNLTVQLDYQHPGSRPLLPNLHSGTNTPFRLDHLAPLPVSIRLTAPGYQERQFPAHKFATNEVLAIPLADSIPTRGRVLSKVTGKPLENAEVRLSSRRDFQGSRSWGFGDSLAPLLARTDSAGQYTVTALDESLTYQLLIQAPGHGKKRQQDVRAGNEIPDVILGPVLEVEGYFTGNLELLKHSSNVFGFGYGIEGHDGLWMPVTPGAQKAQFKLTNLWEGTLNFWIGDDRTRRVVLTTSLKDYVIDLSRPLSTSTPADLPTTRRKVRLELIGAPDAQTLSGSLSIRTTELISVPLTNGLAEFEMGTPGSFHLEGSDLKSHWIEPAWDVVGEGTEPLTKSVEVIEAGGIFGTVEGSNELPLAAPSFSVIEVDPFRRHKDASRLNSVKITPVAAADGMTARFSAQPLPIGSRFRILMHSEMNYVMSDLIALTPDQPIQQIQMRLKPGVPIGGIVVSTDGRPIPRARVQMGFEVPMLNKTGWGKGIQSLETDTQGRFRFPSFNPELIPYIKLRVHEVKGWQPASLSPSPGETNRITLSEGMALKGKLVDSVTGKPMSGTRVLLMRKDPPNPSLFSDHPSDAQGNFEFTTLQSGLYMIAGVTEGELSWPGNRQREVNVGETNALLELKVITPVSKK